MSGHQQPSPTGLSARTLEFIVTTAIGAGAVSVEVFLHRRFGSRYLNIQAASVLLLIPLYSCFWEGHDLRPLYWFLFAYLLMVIVARLSISYRQWKRDNEHTFYNGLPILLSRSAYRYERIVKQFVEPFLVIVVAFLLTDWNPPLGMYLVMVAFCLFVHSARMNGYSHLQLMDLHDAVIEQQQRAERFRELRPY